ncbi:MAG: 2-C-methyl-D-erythritol 4-phosphate cytidylyltransferase [Clostridia bacterium]|nr:2-C-methyl-D-erythritol 4-phosphate cytidylyltransferase [Clostridia bacterium]
MFNLFAKISGLFKPKKSGDVSAVILCAGNSTRFSNEKENKQLYNINGKCVISHTIEAFQNCPAIREIILVVRREDAEEYNKLVCLNNYFKVECIVIGGETRQISAMRGFKHISDKCKYVAIHDGARCLVTPEIIDSVIYEAKIHDAASAATLVNDTVKITDEDGIVSKTISRENMWNVQTPQIFNKDLYTLCIENAKEKSITVTDDCMLIEAYGHKVKLVETSKTNIKITFKEDVYLAEAILKSREIKK